MLSFVDQSLCSEGQFMWAINVPSYTKHSLEIQAVEAVASALEMPIFNHQVGPFRCKKEADKALIEINNYLQYLESCKRQCIENLPYPEWKQKAQKKGIAKKQYRMAKSSKNRTF